MWDNIRQWFGVEKYKDAKRCLKVKEGRTALVFSYGAPFAYLPVQNDSDIFYAGHKRLHPISPMQFQVFCRSLDDRLSKSEGELLARGAIEAAKQFVKADLENLALDKRLATISPIVRRAPDPYCYGEPISLDISNVMRFCTFVDKTPVMLFSPIHDYHTPTSSNEWQSVVFRAELKRHAGKI